MEITLWSLHWLKNITDYRADRGAKLCGRRTLLHHQIIVALQTWADYCRADHGDNSVIVAPLERKEQIFGMKW
ncbi:MAG: hypothetical protein ACW99G_14310 [Candidatus Thorarchaeota archaeon]